MATADPSVNTRPGSGAHMTSFGFTLSSEEHDPATLVEQARMAEDARLRLRLDQRPLPPVGVRAGPQPVRVVGARCPVAGHRALRGGRRASPARSSASTRRCIAQAAATTSRLLGDRFSLGVGTGEALNEHILGHRWPTPEARLQMLEEAVEVMRAPVDGRDRRPPRSLLRGRERPALRPARSRHPGHRLGLRRRSGRVGGAHRRRLLGPRARPRRDRRLSTSTAEPGPDGPRSTCAGRPTSSEARETMHRVWPNSGLPGQLAQDLPTWTHFEQATSMLTVEQTTGVRAVRTRPRTGGRGRPILHRRRLRPRLLPPGRPRPGRLHAVLGPTSCSPRLRSEESSALDRTG